MLLCSQSSLYSRHISDFFSCGATQGRRHNCVNIAFEVAFEHLFQWKLLNSATYFTNEKINFEFFFAALDRFLTVVILDLYGISLHAVVFFLLEFDLLGKDWLSFWDFSTWNLIFKSTVLENYDPIAHREAWSRPFLSSLSLRCWWRLIFQQCRAVGIGPWG